MGKRFFKFSQWLNFLLSAHIYVLYKADVSGPVYITYNVLLSSIFGHD